MSGGGLRGYLSELSPQARAMLLGQFEQRVSDGDGEAASSIILGELRELAVSEPLDEAAALFFRPVEPYLVDDRAGRRHPGRLARCVIAPLWHWLGHGLLPDAVARYAAEARQALDSGEIGTAEALAETLQKQVLVALRSLFAADGECDTLHQALDHTGSWLAVEDIAALRWLLRGRDMLAKLDAALPERIGDLAVDQVQGALTLIDATARPRDIFPFALACLMNRLAHPAQIVRLAAYAAGSRRASRMLETPFGLALAMAVSELERMVDALARAVDSGDPGPAAGLLRRIDGGVRELRAEVDIPVASSIGRQLAALSERAAALGRAALQIPRDFRLSA